MTAYNKSPTIIPRHWLHCGELYFDTKKHEMVYLCTQCIAERDKTLIIDKEDFIKSNCFNDLTQFCAHKLMHFQHFETEKKGNHKEQNHNTSLECEAQIYPEPQGNLEPQSNPEPKCESNIALESNQLDETTLQTSNVLETSTKPSQDPDQPILFSPFDPDSVKEFYRHEQKIRERRTTITYSDNPPPIPSVDLTIEKDTTIQMHTQNRSLKVSIERDRIRSLPQTDVTSDFLLDKVLTTIPTPEQSPRDVPVEKESNSLNHYQCEECTSSFCHDWQLDYHKRLHLKQQRSRQKSLCDTPTKTKPYEFPCGLCSETFSDDVQLRQHMCWHMDFSKPDELDNILGHLDGDDEPKSMENIEPQKKKAKKTGKPKEPKIPKLKIQKKSNPKTDNPTKKKRNAKQPVTLYECNIAAQRALACEPPAWMVSINNMILENYNQNIC